jgi:hypothetical protein
VARRLVRHGVAECAVTSEGAAWWATDDIRVGEDRIAPIRSDTRPVATGVVDVRPAPGGAHSSVRLPPDLLQHAYAAEGLLSWAWSRHAEVRLFGDGPLPPRYVWAQLGACTFTAVAPEARRIVLYPQLKIFESGVVVVHLRMLSPERPVLVEEFINRYLNAGLAAYRWVNVPLGIAAWSPLAAPESGVNRWYRRPRTAYLQWYHQRAVARHATVDEGGDFAFWQVSLGLAQDAELLRQAVDRADPEISRRAREVLRSEAATRGVHLSPDLETVKVDAGVTVVAAGETVTQVEADRPIADSDLSARSGTAPPNRVVDIEEIKAAAMRGMEGEARRLGREVGEQVVNASEREPETFRGLALMAMAVAGLVAGTDRRGPRRGIALALLGPGTVREVGRHWTGRPHAHLLRFADQSASAAANALRFGADLGSVMLRAVVRGLDRTLAARSLPQSTRPFDDHGAYLASQGTLWVYTSEKSQKLRRGTRPKSANPTAPSPPTAAQVRGADSTEAVAEDLAGPSASLRPGAERGMQVFEHQAKVELLEYGYMLHRRIADRVTDNSLSADRVAPALLAAQRDLADFEWALQDTGRYGEVREQLEAGLTAYGVPKLRERVAGVLRVRQEAALYYGGLAAGRWAAFLGLVAGARCSSPRGCDSKASLAATRAASSGRTRQLRFAGQRRRAGARYRLTRGRVCNNTSKRREVVVMCP